MKIGDIVKSLDFNGIDNCYMVGTVVGASSTCMIHTTNTKNPIDFPKKIQVPTEDGIDWQDIRLVAGEGKLTQKTIKQAIDVIRKQRRPK